MTTKPREPAGAIGGEQAPGTTLSPETLDGLRTHLAELESLENPHPYVTATVTDLRKLLDSHQERVQGSTSRGPRDYLKPWEVQELIRLLAAQELSKAQCARKLGISPSAVTQFSKRHAQRIAEVRAHLDDEFAGLWAARKEARIAAYQDEYERLDAHRAGSHPEWSKARQAALRAVADELGQIPNRSQVQVSGGVTVQLVGVDVDECFPDPLDVPASLPGEVGSTASNAVGQQPLSTSAEHTASNPEGPRAVTGPARLEGSERD